MDTVKSDPHSSGEVWRALRAAAPQTVPVFAGYLVLGMGYGIYVQSLGLPVWMPMLMGTVVYGGSLEFVLASLLLGAFAPLSAFLMAPDDPGAAPASTALPCWSATRAMACAAFT